MRQPVPEERRCPKSSFVTFNELLLIEADEPWSAFLRFVHVYEKVVSDDMDRQMKVAILGFGTVGNSVARILCEHPPQGVELSCIFNRGIDRKRVSWIPSSVLWTENFDEVLAIQA